MGNLQEELLRKGFVSEKQYQEREAEKQLAEAETAPKRDQVGINLSELDYCGSMREFKEIAKKILSEDIAAVSQILKKAHRFKNDDRANKKFIWFFYKLRDRINELPPAKHPALLQKAFRKSNPSFEIE